MGTLFAAQIQYICEVKKRKSNEEKIGLPAVLRRGPINLVAFGYVAASCKCGASITESIQGFIDHFNLSERDIDPDTIYREVNRMTVDYLREGI